jgi:hypothetical protein
MSVEETEEGQKIVGAKRRSARRHVLERIYWQQICHIGQKGLNRAGLVVVEDPVFAPVVFPGYQFVRSATERMKRMDYPKPSGGDSQTICIR